MIQARRKGELISDSLAHLSSQSRLDRAPKLSNDHDGRWLYFGDHNIQNKIQTVCTPHKKLQNYLRVARLDQLDEPTRDNVQFFLWLKIKHSFKSPLH